MKSERDEQLHHQVGCLNLITNLVIVWNTVYIAEVIQQLRLEGQTIQDQDLMHIWPTRHAHINVYGKYHFNPKDIGQKRALRSLRMSGLQPWRPKFFRC
ncbi:MAG: Tn3 family transposase [Cyanobacteria bacterium SID2]|nr:Tn3 family transposase [Cyanobacteria bacterium SID2]MBP0005613.1 Tn3 family transposase [Cyanobacteria bacterium SBC]